jgi:hypothetical protein
MPHSRQFAAVLARPDRAGTFPPRFSHERRATVPCVLGRILAICLGLMSACYSPPKPDCGFTCGRSGECPDDYSCAADGVCHRNGSPANLICMADARVDAPQPIDAPRPDADVTPPAVFATMPQDEDVDVPLASTIRVQFTEAVTNVDSSSFVVSTGAVVLPGTLTNTDPLTYVFEPTSPLPAAATIDVSLTTAIADTAGNHLLYATFSFKTVP